MGEQIRIMIPMLRMLLLSYISFCVSTHGALADEMTFAESGGWQYALSLVGGGGVDETKLDADEPIDCANRFPDLCSEENYDFGFAHLDLRIFTPQQLDMPGNPRFFLRAGVGQKFGNHLDVEDGGRGGIYTISADIEQRDVIWDIGIGVALPLTWGTRSFQIETSISYGQEPVSVRALYHDDDAGRFRTGTHLTHHFVKPMLELATPLVDMQTYRLDFLAGTYFQVTLSNQKSKQDDVRFVDLDYEKSVGFGGFLGLRLTGMPGGPGSKAEASMRHGPARAGSWQFAVSLIGGGGQDDTMLDFGPDLLPSKLRSEENFDFGFVHFDFRIFTPQQLAILGDPRFFVRAGLGQKFGKYWDGHEEFSGLVGGEDIFSLFSADVKQRGVIWDVGLGLAFPLTWGSRSFQIEPSVSYGQETVRAEALGAALGPQLAEATDGDVTITHQFVKPMLEVTTPLAVWEEVRLDALAGSYLQVTLSNQKNKQERELGSKTFEYEKSLGFGGFVGVRLTMTTGE